jgi:hypothetical protein
MQIKVGNQEIQMTGDVESCFQMGKALMGVLSCQGSLAKGFHAAVWAMDHQKQQPR